MNWEQELSITRVSEAAIHAHCPEERAELFSAAEGGSVEFEVMDLLYALVRLFKPRLVLDTGTHLGLSAAAIACALRDNGGGKVVSVELNPDWVQRAKSLILKAKLESFVTLVQGESLPFLQSLDAQKVKFNFAFFDTATPIRALEFKELYHRGMLTDLIGFHDTSRLRERSLVIREEPQAPYVQELDGIEREFCRGGIECGYSRGVRIMQLDPSKNPAFR